MVPEALGALSGQSIELPANTISKMGIALFTGINGAGWVEAGLSASAVSAYDEFSVFDTTLPTEFIASSFALDKLDSCELSIDGLTRAANSEPTPGRLLLNLIANARQQANSGKAIAGVILNDDTGEIVLFDESLPEGRTVEAGDALSVSTPAGSWPDLVLEKVYGPYYLWSVL